MLLAIDAGHGMANQLPGVYDPGAVGGQVEADVVLTWALAGKWVLGQQGIATFLTRWDATSPVPLSNRVRRAQAAGATHYLSLHCNAGPQQATGLEVYYRTQEDRRWAVVVEAAALKGTGLPSRGLKTEGQSQHNRLAVLEFPGPSCLLELGFVTNPGDCSALVSRQARIAFWQELALQFKGE